MSSLPVTAPLDLRPALEDMLLDLEVFRLEVGLIPAPDRRHYVHCVRTVFCANPAWYRELAATYQRRRRTRRERYADPRFCRADVLRALRLLLSSGSRSYLAWGLLAAAKERLRTMRREAALERATLWPYDEPLSEVPHAQA